MSSPEPLDRAIDYFENLLNLIENLMKKLNHPNIIKFKEFFTSKKPQLSFNIVCEYADGGDLSKVVETHAKNKQHIQENMIWFWFLQLCQAIRYMHSKHIIHRDIKCLNTFLTKKQYVKINL